MNGLHIFVYNTNLYFQIAGALIGKGGQHINRLRSEVIYIFQPFHCFHKVVASISPKF